MSRKDLRNAHNRALSNRNFALAWAIDRFLNQNPVNISVAVEIAPGLNANVSFVTAVECDLI